MCRIHCIGLENMLQLLLISLALTCEATMALNPSSVNPVNQTVVFQKGELGYFCFRIPVLHLTSKNTVLAFAEGRGQHTSSCSDHGDVHIVMKRSTDYGQTWSSLMIIHKESDHTIGNPAPVEDRTTGRIVLVFSRDSKKILQMESLDDGLTWGSMRDITSMFKVMDWIFIASGPSDGLTLPSGRFLICMYGTGEAFNEGPGSFSIWSDDGGKLWTRSPSTSDPSTGECKIVPLDLHDNPDPKHTQLLMYMRTSSGIRTFGYSADSGESWYNISQPKTLNPQTAVQGSILAVTYVGVKYNTHLYVSQPHSLTRLNMTIFHSTDGGVTWQEAYILWKGPSGYSSMIKHHDAPLIYCLYEKGNVEYWETLTMATFSTLI